METAERMLPQLVPAEPGMADRNDWDVSPNTEAAFEIHPWPSSDFGLHKAMTALASSSTRLSEVVQSSPGLTSTLLT